MNFRKSSYPVTMTPVDLWLPWWYRPSAFLVFLTIPTVIILSFSDSSMTLSRGQHIYTSTDLVIGVIAILMFAIASRITESNFWDSNFLNRRKSDRFPGVSHGQAPRISEAFLGPKLDLYLMAVFIVAHLIFFRNFITNPALAAGVLGGNLELKHTFKTIPGVTTWTQVSILIGTLRGLRWAGILPGKVKLISLFHLIFFGVLFLRAILWSERLALIEGALPFFICALPKVATLLGKKGKVLISLLPLFAPLILYLVFVFFEFFRSWQSYSGDHSNVFVFGWRRLYSYYFEAMNTGAALLRVSGFYEGVTLPISEEAADLHLEGLHLGTLDVEFNNPSGIWALLMRTGNVLGPLVIFINGAFMGVVFRYFRRGKLFGLFYPIVFMCLFEIVRIFYYPLTNRVLPSTLIIVCILVWSLTVRSRLKLTPRSQ